MKAALLPDRGIIRISGADARRFLQGLCTSDIETMTAATPRFAALLTPQGKIVADFLIFQSDTADGPSFLIDCERTLAGPLVTKLGFYKLRAAVTVEDAGETASVLALWDEDPATTREADPPWFADPRLGALGWRAVVSPDSAAELAREQGAQLVDAQAYDAHRIALGIPRGGQDFAYGDAFPHEAGMDQLGGVDFSKGCYVGQEVVSRMAHRANVRSRVIPVALEGVAPEPGTAVSAGEKTVGTMGSAADGRGLALLRLDRVADAMAAGLPLQAGQAQLAPIKPAWAAFAWPGEAKAAE